MAIITPLLDTLLHEVLGRRMDAPARTPLNPPVAPVYPSKAPQAVQGDSRLQSRGGTAVQDVLSGSPRQAHAQAPPTAARGPASAYTSLSPAAHLISAVLDRFPAPPSVIRITEPLLPSAATLHAGSTEGESLPQGRLLLQEALRSSISNSGLFYESHLKAWFRGRLTLDNLLRQPQMQGTVLTAVSESPPAAKAPPPTAGNVQLGGDSPQTAAPPENLHSIIRHQLELMVNPILRWEGEIWPGFFMSLILDVPREGVETPIPEEGQGEEAAGECTAELQLRLDGLGALVARLALRDHQLKLNLNTSSASLLALMHHRQELLMDALGAGGFQVDLEMTLIEAADDPEN